MIKLGSSCNPASVQNGTRPKVTLKVACQSIAIAEQRARRCRSPKSHPSTAERSRHAVECLGGRCPSRTGSRLNRCGKRTRGRAAQTRRRTSRHGCAGGGWGRASSGSASFVANGAAGVSPFASARPTVDGARGFHSTTARWPPQISPSDRRSTISDVCMRDPLVDLTRKSTGEMGAHVLPAPDSPRTQHLPPCRLVEDRLILW